MVLVLSGCATVTAVPTASNPSAKGIRIYAPKALVVVNGTGVSTVIVPDCSKEYALQIDTIFAKQKATIEMSNGMVTKVDVDQDTTAIPLKLLDLANKVIPAGGGTSDKAQGGTTDRFGIFEASCSDGRLALVPLQSLDANLIKTATTPAVAAPTESPPQARDGSANNPKGKPIQN